MEVFGEQLWLATQCHITLFLSVENTPSAPSESSEESDQTLDSDVVVDPDLTAEERGSERDRGRRRGRGCVVGNSIQEKDP